MPPPPRDDVQASLKQYQEALEDANKVRALVAAGRVAGRDGPAACVAVAVAAEKQIWALTRCGPTRRIAAGD